MQALVWLSVSLLHVRVAPAALLSTVVQAAIEQAAQDYIFRNYTNSVESSNGIQSIQMQVHQNSELHTGA